MRIAIIGAGISGLALAYYLQKLGVRYDLFESDTQVGGLIKSLRQGPYQLELGPHALQMNQDLQELLQELKLEEEVIRPAVTPAGHSIRIDGEYYPSPGMPNSVLLDAALHRHSKQNSKICFASSQEEQEETDGRYLKRQSGQNETDDLVEPEETGTFTDDPNVKLLAKTFPYLKAVELADASALNNVNLAPELPPNHFFSLQNGLQSFPLAIASKLVSLHVGHQVEMIHRAKGKYLLSIQHDVEGLADEEFDAVVLALPAPAAAELLDFTAPGLAAALQNVTYLPLTVVHTAYRQQALDNPLQGFGVLYPQEEQPFSLGTIWSSSLFPDLCPADEVLFSSLVTGNPSSETSPSPQAETLLRVHEELKENHGIKANLPTFQHCHSWPQALPKPDIFMTDVHVMAQALEEDLLFACANWISGPAVEDCIQHAKALAQKIYSIRPSFQ